MKLSRRNVLGLGAAMVVAATVSSKLGVSVIDGYLKPYGAAGSTFVLSPTPLHCLDCFKGRAGDLLLVHLPDVTAPPTGKVRVAGVMANNPNKSAFFNSVLQRASLVKKAFV